MNHCAINPCLNKIATVLQNIFKICKTVCHVFVYTEKEREIMKNLFPNAWMDCEITHCLKNAMVQGLKHPSLVRRCNDVTQLSPSYQASP